MDKYRNFDLYMENKAGQCITIYESLCDKCVSLRLQSTSTDYGIKCSVFNIEPDHEFLSQ